MQTKVLPIDDASLAQAASILREGGLVAFPTETVYGLGANALDANAVPEIFAAKGRPADNPLIVHIFDRAQLSGIVAQIPARAKTLMDAFWPGPLTLVMPKADAIPLCVTAGLASVAVRCPSHPGARALLQTCALPIAAPSANRSGRPSPTLAKHVLADMQGRIPLILDGGACEVGLESTVASVVGEQCVLLRPGGVTKEMLELALGEPVTLGHGVLQPLAAGETALSPGMKHTHYKPKARVVVFRGEDKALALALAKAYDEALQGGEKPLLLAMDALLPALGVRDALSAGKDYAALAACLFARLRQADELGCTLLLMQGVPETGMGLAVMNRALRAAGFDERLV